MRYAYPVDVLVAGDGVTVTCPDIPELVTEGRTRAEALERAADALVTALSLYVEDGRALPHPSPARGRSIVSVSILEAAKLALHDAMSACGISNVELGRTLMLDEKAVRRLRDPLHRSHIGTVEAALRILGKRVEIDISEVA